MKPLEILFGNPEEKEAVQALTEKPKGRPLSYEEQTRYSSAQDLALRLRVRQVFLATAAAIGAVLTLQSDPTPTTVSVNPTEESVKKDPESRPTSEKDEEIKWKIQRVYDQGFDQLMKDVPDDAERNPALSVLSTFKKFKKEGVKWATLKDGTYLAQESGQRASAYLAVTPFSEAKENPNQPLLGVNYRDNGVVALQIGPKEITEGWAGVFLLHELVHLYDRVAGIEKPNPSQQEYLEGEARAYEVELLALNHSSQGEYRKNVQKILKELKIDSSEKLFEVIKGEELHPYFRSQDELLGFGRSLNEQEGGLRAAIHIIAIGYELAQQQEKTPTNQHARMAEFIGQLMRTNEAGRNIPQK